MRTLLTASAALAALFLSTLPAPAVPVETIVVSATRTEQPAEKTGQSVSVFTGADLQVQQIVVLTDALSEVPGTVVVRNGGVGQNATIGIRGAPAGQHLVLIDGVRINDVSSTDSQALLGDVFVNNIERVEVLRGPQSTLYGSDAIGGVVDIITKRGGDSPFALNASVEGGSFDTVHLNAAATGTADIVEYGAALNYFSTGGVSAADSRNGNTEADGYRNFGATANIRIKLDEMVSVDLRAYFTDAHVDFDGFPPPLFSFADTRQSGSDKLLAGYAGVNVSLFDGRILSRFAFAASDSDRKTFDPTLMPPEDFFAKGNADRFEYQGIIAIDADNQATFGAETETTHITTASVFSAGTTRGEKRISSVYAQWQSTLMTDLTVTGGVRYDDDEEFGGHTSIKAAAAYQLPDWDATLRATYGDGFKAPSLFELFSEFSNPIAALKPEVARGWEVGVDKGFWDDRIRASLTYFERHATNQIDFQNCFSASDAPGCPFRLASFGYYVNIGKARAIGVETALNFRLDDTLSASLTYSNLSAKNVLTGLDLARRPRNLASAVVTWLPMPGATLGGSVTYEGKRFDDAGNFTPLSGNTTVNLFGSYDLTQKWQLFGRIENVFNDRTEQVAGFGVPGIGAFGGVRASF